MRNEELNLLLPYIDSYSNREVVFRFRGRNYHFSLSHGIFSSADIDTGSRFLLKVFSDFLDAGFPYEDREAQKRDAPLAILDSGSGVGVLGICAAGALIETRFSPNDIQMRFQDRDELARIFTAYNAGRNGFNPEHFNSCAEPLLAGPAGQSWDLILTNIPAKAGLPVLEDFLSRSAGLLKKDGRVFLVAVNTLAGFFRSKITACSSLIKEERGKEHTVFVYGEGQAAEPVMTGEDFFINNPAYLRISAEYQMEETSYHIDSIHGAEDFDNPGGEIQAAAKLTARLIPKNLDIGAVLIHEGGPGHFPAWLISGFGAKIKGPLVLSGRNILSLEAARNNCMAAFKKVKPDNAEIKVIPSADLSLDYKRIIDEAASPYSVIASFPKLVPMTDRLDALWDGYQSLLAPGGIVVTGFSSTEAERFDRKKPTGFIRMGDIKRKGYRALMYRKQ